MRPFLDVFAPHRPRGTADLLGPMPTVIAHRGGAANAPENTLAAVERAVSLGVGIEVDVTLCRTGEIVVIHDDTVDRTTDGQGAVADLDLDALRSLDAGRYFGREFVGEKIPTLAEVLDLARRGAGVIDVELKTGADATALSAAFVEAVRAAGVVEQTLVTSFDPYLLEAVRRREPKIRRGQLVGTFEETDLAWYEKFALSNLLLNARALPDVIVAQDVLVDSAYLRRMRARGYAVLVWTVDDPTAMASAIATGVDGLITDRPRVALDVVSARK